MQWLGDMTEGDKTPDSQGDADADRIADAGGVPVVPRRYIVRAALLDRLDRAADDRLIVVRGSAGAGKSSLISAWVRRTVSGRLSSVWVTVDRSAVDRAALWQAVESRLRDPLVGHDIFPETDGESLPADAIVRRLEQHPHPLLLVIDDFDLADPTVTDDVDRLLTHNTRLRVVVTSRASTALESPAVARRHLPVVIEGPSLAFTEEETVAAVLASDRELDEADARSIHEATDGWPLGVRVAILEFGQRGAVPRAPLDARLVAERVAGHAEEVFAGHDPDQTEFATRVALAPRVPAELATVLTRTTDAQRRLDELEAAGVGAWRVSDGQRAFVFQPSIRRALERELERREPEEVPRLRRELAEWLDAHGEGLEALRQFSLIGDYASMSRVLGRHFTYFIYYHSSAALEIMTTIPRPQLRRNPTLAVMMSLLYAGREPAPSERVRNLAELGLTIARARAGKPGAEEDFWTTFALHGGLRLVGNFAAAASSADRLIRIIDSVGSTWRTQLGDAVPSAWSIAGMSFLLVGRTSDARLTVRRVQREHGPARYVGALAIDANIAVLRGELAGAAAVMTDIEGIPSERWRGKYPGVGWHIAEAIGRLETWDRDGALSVLSETEPHLDNLEQWPLVLWAEGQAQLLRDSAADALEAFSDRRARFQRRAASPYTRSLIEAVYADLLLAAGLPRQAERALQGLSTEPHVVVSLARLELARGEHERSLALVNDLAWSPEAAPGDREGALVLSAVALGRLQRTEAARRALEHAVALARLHGHFRPLALAPRLDILRLLTENEADVAVRLQSAPDPFGGIRAIGSLTKREQQVLEALAETGSLEEIAARLFVSINTVRTQLQSVYRKLGATSRGEALEVAARNGLLRR